MTHQELMIRAIQLAVDNVKNGGGPFGAVIARNGEIIAEGVNRVTPNHDPTAHAEVQAIRAAAARLENFDLAGCRIYSSCDEQYSYSPGRCPISIKARLAITSLAFMFVLVPAPP